MAHLVQKVKGRNHSSFPKHSLFPPPAAPGVFVCETCEDPCAWHRKGPCSCDGGGGRMMVGTWRRWREISKALTSEGRRDQAPSVVLTESSTAGLVYENDGLSGWMRMWSPSDCLGLFLTLPQLLTATPGPPPCAQLARGPLVNGFVTSQRNLTGGLLPMRRNSGQSHVGQWWSRAGVQDLGVELFSTRPYWLGEVEGQRVSPGLPSPQDY